MPPPPRSRHELFSSVTRVGFVYEPTLEHSPQIVCTKVREGDKRIVRLKEGAAEGRHVVIVDDLVQSGGTLIECQVCASPGACIISSEAAPAAAMPPPSRLWARAPRRLEEESNLCPGEVVSRTEMDHNDRLMWICAEDPGWKLGDLSPDPVPGASAARSLRF